MPTLLYRGFNPEGRRMQGSKNFASEKQMEDYLHKRDISGYEIFKSQTTYKTGLYKLVSPKELSIFCKQMSVLFFSHVTLMEGILILADQTENKQLKLALTEINGLMSNDNLTLAESMSMYEHIFTSYLLNMVIIGETSGTLDNVFSRMSLYFENESKIRKRIRTAVAYPAVLSALMAAIIVILIVRILPMFSDILESMGASMPAATKIIISGSSALAIYSPFIIAVIVAVFFGLSFYFRTDKGAYNYDKSKFSLPVVKYVNSRVITARFSRSLAILLKSGVQLLNALENVSTLMDNKFLEGKLIAAVEKIKAGGDVTEALEEIGVFPVLFMKMFILGERTGNLDEMLDKCASVFDDEADDAIERFTLVLEPLLIIILSIVVGAILLSVILPMITIMNSIG